jgi:hypothetical protein
MAIEPNALKLFPERRDIPDLVRLDHRGQYRASPTALCRRPFER